MKRLANTLRNWLKPVGKTKKQYPSEREDKSGKVQYKKRRIEESEASKQLKEYEDRRTERRTD